MFCAFLFDILSIRSLCSRHTTIMLIFFYRTSLFITCSGLYGLFLFVVCIAFLAAEISTHSVPLHYFEVYYQRNFALLHGILQCSFFLSGSFYLFVCCVDPFLALRILLLAPRVFVLWRTSRATNSPECVFPRE